MRKMVLGVATAVAGLVVAMVPTTYADDGQAAVENVADLVAEAAPYAGEVVKPDPSGDAVVAEVANVAVSIPVDGDQPIVIEQGGPSDELPALQVSLPDEVSVKDAKMADNGTVVYVSNDKHGADVAVQVLDDGSVRMQTVTKSAVGPHEFTYDFGDAVPIIQQDGSVNLVQTTEAESYVIEATVGTIEPAWAVDADGNSVDTHYEVNSDGSLVQIITPDTHTAYPIVADPQIEYGRLGNTIYFNRTETQKFELGVEAVHVVAALLPAPYSIMVDGMALLITAQAAYANHKGQCISMHFLGSFLVLDTAIYSGGYCR